MRKLVLAVAVVATMAGCSSLRHDNLKDINKADEMFLCHAAYEGMDFSVKNMARTELGMRGINWESSSCMYHAQNEEKRREMSGDLRPTFYYDKAWSKRAKQYEESGQSEKLPTTEIESDKDAIVIDGEFFKNLLK